MKIICLKSVGEILSELLHFAIKFYKIVSFFFFFHLATKNNHLTKFLFVKHVAVMLIKQSGHKH